MWTKSYSTITKDVSAQQMWKLFEDVNNWHTWDEGIEFAKMKGKFEKGNIIELRPKGGPTIKVELLEINENKGFLDVTKFPFGKMFDRHSFEETKNGLRITNTISVSGILGFFWVKMVAQKIVASAPTDIQNQIEKASKINI